MLRWNDVSDIPDDLGPAAVTLGNFDGVHRGHCAVLGRLMSVARERGLAGVAVTFDPHPAAVLRPGQAPGALTSLSQRLHLLGQLGLAGVLVMEFTPGLAAWTPREFVQRVLLGALKAQVVVVGKDTRFGAGNSGDVTTLRQLGAELGFDVIVVREAGVGMAGDERWSSSLTRRLLAAGDVAGAAGVLGRPHRVSGVVVHGDHRGRTLGFPTANLSPDCEGLVPADGIYAGWLIRQAPDGEPAAPLPAAISVGTNPTFAGTQRRVEAYVLDRDDLDLYDEVVSADFVQMLRPTLTFGSAAELQAQMRLDVARCRELLGPAAPVTGG